MKRTDADLQRDVQEELRWEPSFDESHVGVAAHDGVVTLTGRVTSYSAKCKAEEAVKRVTGVQAVANELEIKPPSSQVRDDTDIAEAVLRALKWNVNVPHDRIKAMVTDGWVTLEGEVDWEFERRAAEKSVRDLLGVRGVSDFITINPLVSPKDVKANIESAFCRSAELDSKRVRAEAEGGKVTLRGAVKSWAEHDDAGRAAWSVPGVTSVVNLLQVEEEPAAFVG